MESEHGDRLVTALRHAAHDLLAREHSTDMDEMFGDVVVAAVQTVPGADAGGITVSERGEITSRAPTDEAVRKLDELQAQLHEGPCITAATEPAEDGVILVDDLGEEPGATRWPRFAPEAVDLGYRSLMSTQLSVDGTAALNLYSGEPEAFDEPARRVAGLFGLQAAILLHGADRSTQLNIALETRDVIGQAKGILMERFDVRDDQAFQMLVRSSQDTNIKLVDVARWLTTERNTNAQASAPETP